MAQAPSTFRPPWLPHRAIAKRESSHEHDERRGSARERGYTTRWDKARAGWLREHPLCVCCEANGALEEARVLDHVIPHKGDSKLFWSSANWQGLCEWCDKNLKRSVENLWLKGHGIDADLHLARRVGGWVHPRLRG